MRIREASLALATDELQLLVESLSSALTALEHRGDADEGGLVTFEIDPWDLDLIERHAGVVLTDFESDELLEEDGREVDEVALGWGEDA